MKTVPISAYDETSGMIYFARMLDKIRKEASGTLREDFQDNLGRGFDLRCVDYLRVNYDALKVKVLEGGTNEEILDWCFESGRGLNEGDISIWNEYLIKRGINDSTTPIVARRKVEGNLEGRDDIQTMLEFFEVDEGRKP